MAAQVALGTTNAANGAKAVVVATSFDQMAKSRDHPMQLQTVTKEEKQEFVKRGQDMEAFRGERKTTESSGAGNPIVKAPVKP